MGNLSHDAQLIEVLRQISENTGRIANALDNINFVVTGNCESHKSGQMGCLEVIAVALKELASRHGTPTKGNSSAE